MGNCVFISNPCISVSAIKSLSQRPFRLLSHIKQDIAKGRSISFLCIHEGLCTLSVYDAYFIPRIGCTPSDFFNLGLFMRIDLVLH